MSANAEFGWWEQAKFGLMLHWGVSSVLGGQWNGESVPGLGEWIRWHAQIPADEYSRIAAEFHPSAFDADAWASTAKAAGAGYLVFTAKHHDGFALFDSNADPFNSVHHSRWGVDAVREVAEACRRHEVRLGLYYSHAIDWHEPNAAQHWADPNADRRNFEEYFQRKSLPQIRELLTNYGQVAVLWLDMPFLIQPEQCEEILACVRSLQPDCLVSSRLGWTSPYDFRSLGDNELPASTLSERWETAATLNDTWGFRTDDHDWKSPADVLRILLYAVQRGGNLLMNVGPDGEGRIPEPAVKTLLSVGEWLSRNGEYVYGAEPSPFSYDLPSGPITRKADRLWFFRDTGTQLPLVNGMPDSVQWEHREDTPFAISVAELPPGAWVDLRPQPQGTGEILLPATLAETSGSVQVSVSGYGSGGPGELEWEFQSPGGTYQVWAETVWPDHRENGGRWQGGGTVQIAGLPPVVWQADEFAETPTSRYYDVALTRLGEIAVHSAPSRIKLIVSDPLRAQLKCLRLVPNYNVEHTR
jgi:alpha-L-fucosidase